MFGSIYYSANIFVFEALHNFGLFAIFDIQFIRFAIFYVVSCIGSYAKVTNINLFGLFIFFFVKHFNTLEFFQMNRKNFVFVKGILSDGEKMSLGLFEWNYFSLQVYLSFLLDISCLAN